MSARTYRDEAKFRSLGDQGVPFIRFSIFLISGLGVGREEPTFGGSFGRLPNRRSACRVIRLEIGSGSLKCTLGGFFGMETIVEVLRLDQMMVRSGCNADGNL